MNLPQCTKQPPHRKKKFDMRDNINQNAYMQDVHSLNVVPSSNLTTQQSQKNYLTKNSEGKMTIVFLFQK